MHWNFHWISYVSRFLTIDSNNAAADRTHSLVEQTFAKDGRGGGGAEVVLVGLISSLLSDWALLLLLWCCHKMIPRTTKRQTTVKAKTATFIKKTWMSMCN